MENKIKLCTKCKKELPFSCFYLIKRDGYSSRCKECLREDKKEAYKKWRSLHPVVKKTSETIEILKTCRRCGKLLEIEYFPTSKNRLGKKYHRGICRFCISEKYRDRNSINKEKQKCNDIEKFREEERERGRRWRQKHKKEYYVHTLLNRAIKTGKIIKPQRCSKCGREGIKINGHHEDYDKAYDVIWLCDKCHADKHNEIRRNIVKKSAFRMENHV